MNGGKKNKNKAVTVILSFLIAVAVWIVISVTENPDISVTISNLEVRYTGTEILREEGLVLSDTSSVPNMSVVISGKRRDLIDFSDGIYITVDVSAISEAGEYSLPGTISLPSTRISVEREKYGNIPVKTEELISKEIPIKARQVGTLKNSLVKSKPEEQSVVISGAQSEIEKAAYGYVEIDISKLSKSGVIESAFLLMDEYGTPLAKNDTIETRTDKIRIVNTVYERKSLPVYMKLNSKYADEYALGEEESGVYVDVGLSADCAADRVYANIDKTDSQSAEFSLIEEEGMYIPEENATVKLKPQLKKRTPQRIDVMVEARNLAEGLSAEFNGVISGVLAYVTEDTQGNISAYVDLSGMGAGSYNVPAVFESEDAAVKETHYVYVTIK